MLMPKRVKYRKQHRGRRRGKATSGNVVSFGEYGLQAMESCWMTANQIEAARIAMNRYVRRQGKIWIRIFPDKPFTKKPAETRMGSGKGSPEGWVAVVKPGRVLFEMAGVTEEQAREAMRLASHKLPIATRFIKRAEPAPAAAAPMPSGASVEPEALEEAPAFPAPEEATSAPAAPAAADVAVTEPATPSNVAESTEETDGGA